MTSLEKFLAEAKERREKGPNFVEIEDFGVPIPDIASYIKDQVKMEKMLEETVTKLKKFSKICTQEASKWNDSNEWVEDGDRENYIFYTSLKVVCDQTFEKLNKIAEEE